MIYNNFNEWYSKGNHGCSSASRDWLEDIWNDLQPTIHANENSLKEELRNRIKEFEQRKVEHFKACKAFMDKYSKEDAPKFHRWWMDNYKDIEDIDTTHIYDDESHLLSFWM